MASSDGKVAQPELKLILLGKQFAGKTCLLTRWIHDSFSSQVATIGAAFTSRTMQHESTAVNVTVWDTGGAERFAPLAPLYYRNADAAILVYDICDESSFEAVHTWKKALETDGPADIVICIVGAKSDAPNRKVTRADGAEYAKSIGAMFFETSAKDNGARMTGMGNQFIRQHQKPLQHSQTQAFHPCPSIRSPLGADIGKAALGVLVDVVKALSP